MAPSRLQTLKYVGFVVGLSAKFVTGSIFVFNVYQDAIKETFNYTQKDVELLSSMLNVGLGVGFLPGMFYDKFGPTLASGVGFVISVPVFLLIWSTTRSVRFYSDNVWLMAIYFFFGGLGSVFTYMVALNTNVINFHARHTGKVVGFLNAFFAGSPSVFAALYYNVFTHGDHTVVENQDYAGFMVMLAVMYGVVNLLCMAFLRVYKDDGAEKSNVQVKYYKTTNDANAVTFSQTLDTFAETKGKVNIGAVESGSAQKLPLVELLCNVDFHLFTWMFAFAASVGLVHGNNITVASKAVGLDRYNDNLVIIIPITNALISASVGVISDYFKERVPRLSIVTASCLSFILSQILMVIFADRIALMMTATAFAGVGIGIAWSLSPTIMKEMFHVEHLGRNWGIALLLSASVGFASQETYGALYDMHIPEGEGTDCYGMDCIRSGYGVFLGVAVVSLMFGLAILVKRRCCHR